jgi:hypothetical protein
MGQVAKIARFLDEGTIVAVWMEGENVKGTFYMDGNIGRRVLDNLQADAIRMAQDVGLPYGYVGYLNVEFEAEGWGGMTTIKPVGYDAAAHKAAVAAEKQAQAKHTPLSKRV